MNLLEKSLLNFIIFKKNNPNSLIYKYKTAVRSPKDFSVYQNSIDLFINLREGNINPKEVLKNKINFQPNLGQIKEKGIQNKNQKSK